MKGELIAPMMKTLCIRMSAEDLEALRAAARDERVPPTTLARMLIYRGLRDRPGGADPPPTSVP